MLLQQVKQLAYVLCYVFHSSEKILNVSTIITSFIYNDFNVCYLHFIVV